MINFRQKEFTEYDAMRSLYVDLMRGDCRLRIETIGRSELIPILRGNNIVIERFVISPVGRQDKYRMYLKIGAKAKLPDQVRLTSRSEYKKLGSLKVDLQAAAFPPGGGNNNNNNQQNNQKKKNKNNQGQQNQSQQKTYSVLDQKLFNGPAPFAKANLPMFVDINYQVNKLLGEALVYDKKSRTLVLEFDSIRDAINALNVLPFGINYKLYLLDD
jgi:hypothetical protein